VRDFVRHTLVRYEVPEFLYKAWDPQSGTDRDKQWFIDLAGGASVRKLPGWPAAFSRAMAHEFRQAPAWMTVGQALYYAQVRSLGGTVRSAKAFARALADAPEYPPAWWTAVLQLTDVLETPEVAKLVAYWAGVFATFAADGADELPDLQTYWPRPAVALSETSDEAEPSRICGLQSLRLPKGPLYVPKILRRYRVRQVLRSDELIREGQKMQHCVGGYVMPCAHGRSFIFQLTPDVWEHDYTARLTLEVDAGRRLVQAKGQYNRGLTRWEREVVRAWAKYAHIDTSGCWDLR
jgi:hypothetical protein